jgi:protein-S-isoprenylcysteine O-methyltransferase Ste14
VIAAGILLVFIAWALPKLLPSVPSGVPEVLSVGGWILICIGLFLLIWGLVAGGTRPIGGRRWYY